MFVVHLVEGERSGGEREGGRGKEGRQGGVSLAGQTRESLSRGTKRGRREMSTRQPSSKLRE